MGKDTEKKVVQPKGVSSSEKCSVKGIRKLSPKDNLTPKPTKKGK